MSFFFEELITRVFAHLTEQGKCVLILPLKTAELVKVFIAANNMYLHKVISLYSFEDSIPHRELLFFGTMQHEFIEENFIIYDQPKVYSPQYREALKEFLTIF